MALGHLSSWLDAEVLDPAALTVEQIEAFLGERRRTHTGLFSRKALGLLLGWLAGMAAIPIEAADPPRVEDAPELAAFEQYLREERRLASPRSLRTGRGHVASSPATCRWAGSARCRRSRSRGRCWTRARRGGRCR